MTPRMSSGGNRCGSGGSACTCMEAIVNQEGECQLQTWILQNLLTQLCPIYTQADRYEAACQALNVLLCFELHVITSSGAEKSQRRTAGHLKPAWLQDLLTPSRRSPIDAAFLRRPNMQRSRCMTVKVYCRGMKMHTVWQFVSWQPTWKMNLYCPQTTGPTSTLSSSWSYFSDSADPTYVNFHSKSAKVT